MPTNTLLMIQPATFGYNEQTAANNFYQNAPTDLSSEAIQEKSLAEFNGLVALLRSKGVNVIVIPDTETPETPDAIFPNNWISFHESGSVALYPMFAPNRRAERREDILVLLEEKGFIIEDVMDYSSAEEEEIFLEGTGSMVLDRLNQKAYLALSPRSDEELFIEFCEDFEYTPIIFNAYQTVNNQRERIYHTNVMMSIADEYALICLDAIDDKKEKKMVVDQLREDEKEIIAITEAQVQHFAGNALQVKGLGQNYLVMSTQAYQSLTQEQIEKIERYNPIIHSDLSTIEYYGGGSARCMLAEIYLEMV